MTRNIIFDFGAVLVDWNPHYVFDNYFGDRDKADPLVGSAIIDYGGMSSVDKEVLSSLCGVMTQGSFVDTAYRFIRHGDGVPMWEALRYRDAVRSGTADEFVIDDLAVDYEEL